MILADCLWELLGDERDGIFFFLGFLLLLVVFQMDIENDSEEEQTNGDTENEKHISSI